MDQNAWKVQAAVYYSLEASSEFPKERLKYFHSEANAACLSELRSVAASWRPAAARFVAERELDAGGARELSRAIVDVERRREPGASWDATPGDALAAKIWRDAGEVPRRGAWREEVAKVVERGLSVATSDKARAALRARLQEADPSALQASKGVSKDVAQVQTVRLESEEAAFRPVPLLPSLDEATQQSLAMAPAAVTEGVFNSFRPIGGTTWVALPAWAKLAPLTRVVAIQVPDTRALTTVASLSAFPGPCLLIVDRDVSGPPEAQNFYVVTRSSALLDAGGRNKMQRLEIVPGADAGRAGVTVCARLVLACRPPLPPGTPKDMPEGLTDLGDLSPEEMSGDGMDVAFPEDD